MAYAITHHSEGPTKSLLARRGPACCLSTHYIPAHLDTDIFVLTGNNGVQGRVQRVVVCRWKTQEPAGGRRWEEGSRRDCQGRWGDDGRRNGQGSDRIQYSL